MYLCIYLLTNTIDFDQLYSVIALLSINYL